ncbi:MAG: hypothetical protein AAB611_00295 [Patescibacteria group bacterium]
MGEFERLGYWEFWERHGDVVKMIDEQLVVPVLVSLNALISEKWRWDTNQYSFVIDNKEFCVIFDISKHGFPLEIAIQKMQKDKYPSEVGKILVRTPRKQWGGLRKQLATIIISNIK